jgi:hypothetical protein
MQKLTRDKLYTLEHYATIRPEFRAKVIAHKKNRQVSIGSHATLYFEDDLTMQYQIQEILRVERIFEADGIQEELDAYNQLIPDGSNWKAVFMIEYENVDERALALSKMIDIEDKVWVQVGDYERVYAIADEDLQRETAEKTSAVHFLRFELSAEMTAAAKGGANIAMGIDHPEYHHEVTSLAPATRQALAGDLH